MKEALKLALEALESERMYFWNSPEKIEKSISAVKEALAQPEQEPVAWLSKGGKGIWFHEPHPFLEAVPLYTTSPKRKPLTDKQIDNATRKQVDALLDHMYEYGTAAEGIDFRVRAIARAIEAAHGIKE